MDARLLLNKYLGAYPSAKDNVRMKTYPLVDVQSIATGVQDYFYFDTALGNPFLRNKKFPLASNEMFIVDKIALYLSTEINTPAEIDNLNELLQQAYFEVSMNSRVICKLPLLDVLTYQIGQSFTATATATIPQILGNRNTDNSLGRKLSTPIPFIGNSSFKFRLRITSQSATDFNGISLYCYLYGVQADKLYNFNYDEIKGNMFQRVPQTIYETRAITTANQTTFTLFQQGVAENLQSQFFPLSDIDAFEAEAIEFFVNQPDTPVSPETIFNSSITKWLKISIDEVDYWDAPVGIDLLSMIAGFDVALTTTPDTTVTELLHRRTQLILPEPITFPANGKVKVILTQPASSVPATGELTLAFRGTATRRVA